MSAEVESSVIEATKNCLAPFVKKPPLTDKLLRKPPFKFLHDLFTSVIREHGLMQGLFTEAELSSENVKEKEAKMAFLQKAVDVIEFVVERKLSARPSKIVSGAEAHNTNLLLQAIGSALANKTDSTQAVARVLAGDKFGAATSKLIKKKNNSSKSLASNKTDSSTKPLRGERPSPASQSAAGDEPTSASKSHLPSDSGNQQKDAKKTDDGGAAINDAANSDKIVIKDKESKRDRDKEHKKDKEAKNDKEHKKDKEAKKDKDAKKERDSKKSKESKKDNKDLKVTTSSKDDSKSLKKKESKKDKTDTKKDKTDTKKDKSEKKEKNSKKEGSIKPHKTDKEKYTMKAASTASDNLATEAANSDNLATQSVPAPETFVALNDSISRGGAASGGVTMVARPGSARAPPPAVKRPRTAVTVIEQAATLVTSSDDVITGTAPVLLDPVLRGDGAAGDDGHGGDDEDEDDAAFMVSDKMSPSRATDEMTVTNSSDTVTAESHVDSRLVSQIVQVMEQDNSNATNLTHGEDWKRQDREAIQQEIHQACETIQKLTRAVNPLGKMMDFLQEDVDAMKRELDYWRKENVELSTQLTREQRITEGQLEPLRATLAELDESIEQQKNKMAATRAAAMLSSHKLARLVSNAVAASH